MAWIPFAAMAAQGIASGIGSASSNAGYKKQNNFDSAQKILHAQRGLQAKNLGQPGGAYDKSIGLLQGYLDPNSDVYQNFEAPYLQKFNQQVIPGLAERFAGFGAQGGGLSSSGFGQALGAAGANLQTDLVAMKANMQRQSISDILNQYNQMSTGVMNDQPFSRVAQAPGTFSSIMSGIGGMKNPYGAPQLGGENYGIPKQSGSISFGGNDPSMQ